MVKSCARGFRLSALQEGPWAQSFRSESFDVLRYASHIVRRAPVGVPSGEMFADDSSPSLQG